MVRQRAGLAPPKKILTIEDCKAAAVSRGGRCLGLEYKNAHQRLEWECAEGHRWVSKASSVIHSGNWCAACKGLAKKSIKDCHDTASRRLGECLSDEYVNCQRPLIWKCQLGHLWEAPWRSIQRGSWCPYCATNCPRSLQDCQEAAEKKGGRCLSEEYTSVMDYMTWECEKKHVWETRYHSILYGNTWCPHCHATSLSETCARAIFEAQLGIEMPRIRPKFLGGLELDGYNEELGLAFEYNGKQHYEFIEYWHRNQDGFEAQKERDRRKADLCAAAGITLFIVPYRYDYANEGEMEAYIRSLLEAAYLI